MKTHCRGNGMWLLLLLGLFGWPTGLPAEPRRTESELIEMLRSTDSQKVITALERLPDWYPDSPNAIREIQSLLKSKSPAPPGFPPNILKRRAARALGNYHAELSLEEVRIILDLLRSPDRNEAMDGLKALRGLKEPPEVRNQIVAQILPLLRDKEVHIVRDACRTLAVQGDKHTIAALEPLLNDRRADVRRDAQHAIVALRAKP